MKKAFFTFLTLLAALHGKTQINQSTRTDNRLTNKTDTIVQNAASTFMKDTARVGLSIGIIKDGKPYIFNYGSTEKRKFLLPTNNTMYEIGSISKTFTGTLLAQAIVDKKVNLDDDIRKYLTGSYPNLEYHAQPIKIVHLANHTAGLTQFLPDRPDVFQHPPDSIPILLTEVQKNYSKDRFLKDLHTVKIDTVPGFVYKYSNAGAQLISFILEDVYNKSYKELIKKYITEPLRMKHTSASVKNNMSGMLAKGYSPNGIRMPFNPPILMPAGGIFSSVSDMLNYLKFQLDKKNETVNFSHKVTWGDTSDFAIGLYWRMNKTSRGKLKIWHTGGTFGFSSYCVVYPELNTGFVLLSNQSDQTSQDELINAADNIFEAIFNK